MRKKKHGAERILACAALFYNTDRDISFLQPPLRLEIGCGKGGFICEAARREPDVHFIAVEKITDVILLAMERAQRENLTNLRFLNCDAAKLTDILPPHCLERIYLNFSDPWPKKGYYKRRLTYRGFLDIYRELLCDNGAIHMKTDNPALFDFSLNELSENGFLLQNVTRDLHNSEWENDNIHTEYESLFAAQGIKINRLEAVLPSSTGPAAPISDAIPENQAAIPEKDT